MGNPTKKAFLQKRKSKSCQLSQRTFPKDWKNALLHLKNPFATFREWLLNNEEEMLTRQDTPLTLLSTVSKNQAVFARLDSIHQRSKEEFLTPLKELANAINSKNWKQIDWEWSFSIRDNATLDQYIQDEIKPNIPSKNCEDFVRKIDIIELGNYLYLSNIIDEKQLILLHILKNFQFGSQYPVGNCKGDKLDLLAPCKYPNLFPYGEKAYGEMTTSTKPYFYRSKSEGLIDFDEFFTKPCSLARMDSKMCTFGIDQNLENIYQRMEDETLELHQLVFEKYGVNLARDPFNMKGKLPDLQGLRTIDDLARLFCDTAPFKVVPILGLLSPDLYYAHSVHSGKESGTYSRFVSLKNPAIASMIFPHFYMNVIEIIAQEAYHLGILKEKVESDKKNGLTQDGLVEKLGKLSKENTINQLTQHARKVASKKRELDTLKNLIKDYGLFKICSIVFQI